MQTEKIIYKKDGYRQRNVRHFCNQPKAQFGYLTRVTPVCRCLHPFCRWRHLATPRVLRHILASPGYAPGTVTVNVTCTEREFNACQVSNTLQHEPIYPQQFTSYSEILVGNFNFPPTPLHLTPPLGCSYLHSGEKFGPHKLESWGYQAVKTV